MVREAIRELRGSPSPGCSACWPGGSRRGRRLIGSLIGLTDEQFNRETGPGAAALPRRGQARAVLEQDPLKTIAADQASRTEAP